MNTHELLAQEWTTLQNNHERYEMGGLLVKLASVALTGAGFALHLNLKLVAALLVILWVQEGIYRTFQSRLGQRILRVEQMIKLGMLGNDAPAPVQNAPMHGVAPQFPQGVAFQLHSDWLANRPGFLGLVGEYVRSACRPTVAFPHVLLLGLMILRLR